MSYDAIHGKSTGKYKIINGLAGAYMPDSVQTGYESYKDALEGLKETRERFKEDAAVRDDDEHEVGEIEKYDGDRARFVLYRGSTQINRVVEVIPVMHGGEE